MPFFGFQDVEKASLTSRIVKKRNPQNSRNSCGGMDFYVLVFLPRKEIMSEKSRLLFINQEMGQRFIVLVLPLNGRDLR